MTSTDIAELERLLAEYRQARKSLASPPAIARRRRSLETALVHHAPDLLAAAKARTPLDNAYPELAPPIAEWPEERR